jgi:peptidoglycan/xylan/chitin deacetylase (PgdA/CDA1 family)
MELFGISSAVSRVYSQASSTDSVRVHSTANHSPIPILTYHHISHTPCRGSPYRELYVAPNDFARQMHLLRKLGYKGLSMSAIQPYLKGEKDGRVAGITFDDGYLNTFEHALPVLSELGFSATCYVVSSLVGRTNCWDESIGLSTVPLMNARQLCEWAAAGQEVGAHTRHHVHLDKVDDTTACAEIALSKSELEQTMQAPVQHFCYPYGAFRQQHMVMTREAGFVTATTTHRGRCHAGKNMMALPRVSVSGGSGIAAFLFKLLTPIENRPYAPARLRRLIYPVNNC